MFKFERLCFCAEDGNYTHLTQEEKNFPVLHLYEIIKPNLRNPEEEIKEGPFVLRLISENNIGDYPVVYELQHELSEKDL